MKTEIIETLTKPEDAKFAELDKLVEKHAKSFMAVGMALVQIHKERLYRRDFKSFEAYAESRGIKRQTAYKLMADVQLTLELTDVAHVRHGHTPINIEDVEQTSARARQNLKKAPPAKRREIYSEAAKRSGGTPTPKAIIEVTAEVTHKPAPPAPVEAPEPPDIPDEVEHGPAAAPEPTVKATVAGFTKIVSQWEKLINEVCAGNQKERDKYGEVANALAGRLLNPVKKSVFAYGK